MLGTHPLYTRRFSHVLLLRFTTTAVAVGDLVEASTPAARGVVGEAYGRLSEGDSVDI